MAINRHGKEQFRIRMKKAPKRKFKIGDKVQKSETNEADEDEGDTMGYMGTHMIDGSALDHNKWVAIETHSDKDDITDDGYSAMTPSPMSAIGG